MSAVSSLPQLMTLNLQNNSITEISGLEALPSLEWVGLAGNSIAVRVGGAGQKQHDNGWVGLTRLHDGGWGWSWKPSIVVWD